MPFFFSERLPVPTIKSYCTMSVLVFLFSIAYAHNAFQESDVNDGETSYSFQEVFLEEPFCLWSLINMAYCGLFLFGKAVQQLILGDLRTTEEQHIQDKFWNFVFYKMIFVFGVINVQTLHEMLCWSAWFSMIGFFHILGQMCKDRFEYITSSPATPRHVHMKLFLLILAIFLSSIILSFVAVYIGYPEGLSIFVFMMEECVLLGLKSLLLLSRYTIRLFDLVQTNKWDGKAKVVYYINLSIELLYYGVDLVYHFHMLLWSNVFLSLASLVLYWNIQTLLVEIRKKLTAHTMFKKILKSVDIRFPMAVEEEIDLFADHCAICWDTLEQARKLPCGHLFHHTCLCSWLQQDISCPTCRRSLSNDMGITNIISPGQQNNDINADNLQNLAENVQDAGNEGGFRNYFFYLDGQQIANWFPSFSIEVFHGRMEDQEQEVNDMGQQLFSMFPNISHEVILEDLRRTHSIEATADNILEGSINTTVVASEESAQQITAEQTPAILDSTDDDTANTIVSEQISDTESLLGESSGTDEQSVTDSDTTRNCTFNTTNATRSNPVRRRRFLTKTTLARNASDSSSASDQQPVKSETEERRALMLGAIDRRSNSANNVP